MSDGTSKRQGTKCPACNGELGEHDQVYLGAVDPQTKATIVVFVNPYDHDTLCLGRAVGSLKSILASRAAPQSSKS
jgi:hypothetical protein